MLDHKIKLQHQLDDLKLYTTNHSIKLNRKKTKYRPFVHSKTKDFMIQLSLEEGSYFKVIYQQKLVGTVITSSLSWEAHVDYTISRVNLVISQLVKFKQLVAPRNKLITFYVLKVRTILMFEALCYHSYLSLELSRNLELQQTKQPSCYIRIRN